ncbi:hypothetical protein KXR87_21435 [Yokenella regensburgei]|uniref:hypothetical protein n=1 Tax=Yokenella regensburgei TaxID=158877 RepID=UPI003F19253C
MLASYAGYLTVKLQANVISALTNLSLVVKFDLDRKTTQNRIFCMSYNPLIYIVTLRNHPPYLINPAPFRSNKCTVLAQKCSYSLTSCLLFHLFALRLGGFFGI